MNDRSRHMKKERASQILPRRRVFSFVEIVSRSSVWELLCAGMLVYILPVVGCSLIEAIFLWTGHPIVFTKENPATFWDLLYFNFVTILTIGYGDFCPVGVGRFFSVVEGIVGVGLFGILVAAVTTKLLSPGNNSVVFSCYGYYCTDQERFLLIFVNTTNTNIVNVDMTSYFKLGGDWGVRPPIRTPFITSSVQTFFLDEEKLENIVESLRDGDVFRFGLSGQLGLSTYSVAVQYQAHEIIVIQNREALTQYPGFHSPDFNSVDISKMFHYRPPGSLTLSEYVDRKRKGAM
jgi:hypothetical protein